MTNEIWCRFGPVILEMLDALGALLLILSPWVLANLMVDIVLGVIGGIGSIAKTIKNHFKQKREKAKHEEEVNDPTQTALQFGWGILAYRMKVKREEILKKCQERSQSTTQ